jgi:predicted RND superfamily exporter protein
VVLTPLVIWGSNQALRNNSNKVKDWLPASFEETTHLNWFVDEFGGDDFVMVSWEGCTVDDPRAGQYAAELRKPVAFGDDALVSPFREVITGVESLQRLMEPPLDLSRKHARARLAGWAVGKDGDTSCLLAKLTPVGWQHRHAVCDHLYAVADRVPGLSSRDVHVAGSVLDSVAIDRASNDGLIFLSNASFGLCLLLMCCLLRSSWLAGMVFVTAIFCQQMSLALVHFCGAQMDSVLLIVPILVFVLIVSSGVHVANYYRDAIRDNGLEGAPLRAVSAAIAPCWLATATTGLGLGSLLVSFLVPVQKFGFFASFAILLGTAAMFLFLPTMLEQFPPRRAAQRWRAIAPGHGGVWSWLLAAVRCLQYPILAGALLLTAAGIYGVFQLRASVRIHDMFLPSSRVLQDYEWLEDHVGPLVPFEIVLRAPKPSDKSRTISMLQRIQLIGRVHQAAMKVDGMGAAVSAWNFSPDMRVARGGGIRQTARRAMMNRKLLQNRDTFKRLALLRENPQEELWRVSGRAYAGTDIEYTEILAELKATVDPVVAAANQSGTPVTAVYCGGVPLVEKAQNQMIKDLIVSFLVAFAFIAGMMILLMIGLSLGELQQANSWSVRAAIVARGSAAGLTAMFPNILPCVAVLGVMGLARQKLEIGSMMTASVALGIAVDDTVHFITWFRRALANGSNRTSAVCQAYEKCGAAMLQTSCICGFGLLVYALSPFVPIARFAWVMFAMLSSAIAADLIVLPAILLCPLGSVFERHPHLPLTAQ